MTLQGYQIVVCVNGYSDNVISSIIQADTVKKYWRATREEAQELKDELHREFNGQIFIRS